MRLLVDHEIVDLIKNDKAIEGLECPWNDWYRTDSPVQPSSLDLHVGEIFIPGRDKEDFGGQCSPEASICLRTGHTIVVTTLERLKLPSRISGFGFPPSHISELGLLMTNPGHVDPGYTGRLRFTVINVGKADFSLRRGDPLVTLLLFETDAIPNKDWVQRHPTPKPDVPEQSRINRLSRDFIDLESRVRRINLETAIYATVASGILGVFLTLGANFMIDRMTRLESIRDDISQLKSQVNTISQMLAQTNKAQVPSTMDRGQNSSTKPHKEN